MRMIDVLGLINLQYNTMEMVFYNYCFAWALEVKLIYFENQ